MEDIYINIELKYVVVHSNSLPY